MKLPKPKVIQILNTFSKHFNNFTNAKNTPEYLHNLNSFKKQINKTYR